MEVRQKNRTADDRYRKQGHAHSLLSRREVFRMASAASAWAAFGGLPAGLAAAFGEKMIAGYAPGNVPDARTLGRWLKQLHDFGPIRATGTPQCRAFEEWLAKQFTTLGFSLERDQYRLTSWECSVEKDCSIVVKEDGGATRTLEVVAYYPFGGSTRGKAPVSGRVLYGGVSEAGLNALIAQTDAAKLAESIVVIDMPLKGGGVRNPAGMKFHPGTFPSTLPEPLPGLGPSPATQGGRTQMQALEGKCKGLVLCYTDISNEAARHNYLPFSDQHRKIPGLWVGAEGSRYLQSVSGKATLTMRCDATLTPNARADSIVATLKGQSDEVIFLTTHTDGPNEVNDNGALGVLALATYFSKMPAAERKRTLVCSLPTGHYAGGAIADPVTGSGQRAGTRGVMAKRPEMAAKMVAQIALEQMAAMEWLDVNGKWQATGRVALERWIPTPATAKASNQIFLASTAGENPKYSRAVLVESGSAPGEGGAPRSAGIPGIGLMGSPGYFFHADPKGVLDKLSPEVMYNQVAISSKMLVLMNRLSVAQLKGEAPITDKDLFG
jgi:hypothetical protein